MQLFYIINQLLALDIGSYLYAVRFVMCILKIITKA